jgi:hypothetical protein
MLEFGVKGLPEVRGPDQGSCHDWQAQFRARFWLPGDLQRSDAPLLRAPTRLHGCSRVSLPANPPSRSARTHPAPSSKHTPASSARTGASVPQERDPIESHSSCLGHRGDAVDRMGAIGHSET